MIAALKRMRDRCRAAREAEVAMYRRQAKWEWRERQAFIERMIDLTQHGLVDWTQPVPIGRGLFACHHPFHPSLLYICDSRGNSQEYRLVDSRARELMHLIMSQPARLVTRAN